MLTKAEITAEQGNLDGGKLPEIERSQIASLINYLEAFQEAGFDDLQERLAAAEGVPAQQLLAALHKIEAIGGDTTKKKGGQSAIDFDPERDRDTYIEYMLATLGYHLVRARTARYGGSVDLVPTL